MPQPSQTIQLGKLAAAMLLLLFGCVPNADEQVIVYTALDREFSQPIFDSFTEETGIQVLAKFDTEATKTVGLANAIIAESSRPRCDLFWNNEILNSLRLQRRDLLMSVSPKNANGMPAEFRSPKGLWHGFAARARILIVNTELLSKAERPESVRDLADPQWKNRVGMAKPLFGTTATHATVLYHAWGAEEAGDFFKRVKANAKILSGNKQVAMAVARGQLAWGITDTDDAMIEVEKGMPVTIVYPDQDEGALGTLFIPNTLAAIRGSANSKHAQRLIDYLLSPQVEQRLAMGPSAQIPLRPALAEHSRVKPPNKIRAMQVDFDEAARMWDTASKQLHEEFVR
jgi:iron(III) transport system substrate-binding protein